MSQCFAEVYGCSGGNENFELDLFDYATQTDLKGATGIETSKVVSKTDLASLKTKEENLDVDKVKTVPSDLSKLTNVVDNDVIKKTVYDKLVIKVNIIYIKILSTSGLVTKRQSDSDKQGLENNMEDVEKNT